MNPFLIMILFIFTLLSVVLIISLLIYRKTFYNKNDQDVSGKVLTGPDYDCFHDKMLDLIDSARKIPHEDVYITSYDGLKLYGRLYVREENAPVHIQFNGYRGNGIRDFAGGLQLALSVGDNVILVDQRAHGKSDGHNICFGVKERYDVMSWIEFARSRFGGDVRIWLEGVSMGAATVLMASDLNLPDNVRGIVADCPYSSPVDIIMKVGGDLTGLKHVTYPFLMIAARLFAHINIRSSSAIRSVAETQIPILLIHGTGDNFVPFEMSESLYAANPDMITFVPIAGAPHAISYLVDCEKYTGAYHEFLKMHS